MNEVVMALLSGWIIFYFAVFLPGPNTFFVASVGISGQKKQIWGAAVGTAIGSFTWCLLATTGISFLISNLMGWGFIVLKILASLYMIYLAYQIGSQYFSSENQLIKLSNERNFLNSMKKAIIVAYTNPKAFAFWSALATLQFSENLNFSIALIFATGSFFISAMNYIELQQKYLKTNQGASWSPSWPRCTSQKKKKLYPILRYDCRSTEVNGGINAVI